MNCRRDRDGYCYACQAGPLDRCPAAPVIESVHTWNVAGPLAYRTVRDLPTDPLPPIVDTHA